MKRAIKRISVLCIVLVLVVSLCAPAFAVVYPSARLMTARSRTAWRGGSLKAKYYLKCGSFNYRNGYRSQIETAVFRNANGKRYDYKAVNYTGNGNFTHTYYFSKNMPTGKYNVRVRSYYRTSAYNYWRMCGKTVWGYIRLK